MKKMSIGISKSQIEKAFRDIDDPDINDNFARVFPVNHMSRFINYKSMISEKRANVLS